jgi:hypothetical protein
MVVVVFNQSIWLMMTHLTTYQMRFLVKLNKQKNIIDQDGHWFSSQIKQLFKLDKQKWHPMYLGTIIAINLGT